MKIRKSVAGTTDKVEMQMTPMIDIVFQLLTFFVMSFKIATQEGDFDIKMPAPSSAQAPTPPPLGTFRVRAVADPQGHLARLEWEGEPLASFEALNAKVLDAVRTVGPQAANDVEVELDCDDELEYDNTVRAITAISGYIDPVSGERKKLLEKLKFTPPKN